LSRFAVFLTLLAARLGLVGWKLCLEGTASAEIDWFNCVRVFDMGTTKNQLL
jgi:hypothetical protein